MAKNPLSAFSKDPEVQQRPDLELQALFTIINSEGEVLRTGNCPPLLVSHQCEEGEAVILGHPPTEDLSAHVYQAKGWKLRDPRPSDLHVWKGGKWILPGEALEIQKSRAWERVKRARDGQIFGTLTWSDFTFQCDEASRLRLGEQFAIAAIDPEYSVLWVLADNSQVELMADHLQELQRALNQHTQNARKVAEAARTKIQAAKTTKAIEAALEWALGEWRQQET